MTAVNARQVDPDANAGGRRCQPAVLWTRAHGKFRDFDLAQILCAFFPPNVINSDHGVQWARAAARGSLQPQHDQRMGHLCIRLHEGRSLPFDGTGQRALKRNVPEWPENSSTKNLVFLSFEI